MILVSEKISPNISFTPEGYLLAENVNISRIGTLVYGEGEIPVETDNGMIIVERSEDEVFNPESIASFELKPITINHPTEMLDPSNWKKYAVGVIQNVRRDGIYLVADLLIQQQSAINEIRENGLKQISVGYDANYTQIKPGYAIQTNIIGNHISLVENGRAGVQCSIKDHKFNDKDTKMSAKQKNWIGKLFTAVQTNDEALLQDALDDRGDGGDLHIHLAPEAEKKDDAEVKVAPTEDDEEDGDEDQPKDDDSALESRIADLEAVTAKLITLVSELQKSKEETTDEDEDTEKTDEDKETTDEDEEKVDVDKEKDTEDCDANKMETQDDDEDDDYTKDSLQVVLSKASILAPGFTPSKLTTDASTKQNIINIQRQTLDLAFASKQSHESVKLMLGGRKISNLKASTLDAVFNGSVALIKSKNNNKTETLLHNSSAASKFEDGEKLQQTFDAFWAKK